MATGEGKGWRKGLTAATDPRIARAAAANTGKLRLRTWTRTAAERRRLFGTATTVPIEWSPSMAYVVGLTATDGCLLTGRRAINFKSADKDLVLTYIDLLGRTNKIVEQRTRAGRIVYHVQFSDSRLYRWFESIGLTPRKSLTLGALLVPPEFLASLVRGLLDGDGSISNAVWKADTSRRSDYYYEWLRVRFASATSDPERRSRLRDDAACGFAKPQAANMSHRLDASRSRWRQASWSRRCSAGVR